MCAAAVPSLLWMQCATCTSIVCMCVARTCASLEEPAMCMCLANKRCSVDICLPVYNGMFRLGVA